MSYKPKTKMLKMYRVYVIGLYSTELDRVTRWKYPDCGAEWERE